MLMLIFGSYPSTVGTDSICSKTNNIGVRHQARQMRLKFCPGAGLYILGMSGAAQADRSIWSAFCSPPYFDYVLKTVPLHAPHPDRSGTHIVSFWSSCA